MHKPPWYLHKSPRFNVDITRIIKVILLSRVLCMELEFGKYRRIRAVPIKLSQLMEAAYYEFPPLLSGTG